MLGLLIAPLSEIKNYVVVLSFYIKMMKRRTLQACSLRHSIKKGMIYVLCKLNLFKLNLFNTYQRNFYFQYHQHSGKLKIFKNLSFTLLIVLPLNNWIWQCKISQKILSKDGVWREFLEIDSNSTFSKKWVFQRLMVLLQVL